MSERTGHVAGVPCWVDTWQADAAAAASFYEGVFGWECARQDGGALMCRLGGRDVAMIGQLPPEQSHRPAAWLHYVQVDDLDQTVARVGEAGGTTPVGPIDALDGGRIAIVADPAGAHFGIWQLGRHRGAELVNEAGAWSWTQLLTSDQEGAKRFYRDVFGWETEAFGDGPGPVTLWKLPGYVGGEPEQPVPRDVVAGMAALPEKAPRPHWQINFWVEDVDEAVARATGRGGHVAVPPFDFDVFRQAVVVDPAGAAFSVSKATVEGR